MKTRAEAQSWFAQLRSDRALFAVVGLFALFLSALQPAVAAANEPYRDLMVICHPLGDVGPLSQEQEPDCPLCPTGHLCGNSLVAIDRQELPGATIRQSATKSLFAEATAPQSRYQATPPPIRGPPFLS
ncbi:hypothetical protein [Nitratireductor basaltis]|uniref:DUF2946 domain-containing protein n=1 Tax=Nitratireductor basaltis TaxID=472175 RepID=A0A084UDC6_9HYPH|nr:hypothetical protein [Nitratireductor basaltis]KFB10962.1 hypothetical protein EL18_02003 [Nitratireductor basaltis]